MITGVSPKTFENLQLDAGMFLVDFDHSTYNDADALEDALLDIMEAHGPGMLGMTIGGGSFECTPSTRQVEGDGLRYPVVGSTRNDMWTIRLRTTLKEITPENFAHALMCADLATTGQKKVLTVRTNIEDTDYIPKLCWVGETSKGFVLIELDNALNLAGASFTFTDKGEGTIPVDFQAHQGSLTDQQNAPFRIIFFDKAAA